MKYFTRSVMNLYNTWVSLIEWLKWMNFSWFILNVFEMHLYCLQNLYDSAHRINNLPTMTPNDRYWVKGSLYQLNQSINFYLHAAKYLYITWTWQLRSVCPEGRAACKLDCSLADRQSVTPLKLSLHTPCQLTQGVLLLQLIDSDWNVVLSNAGHWGGFKNKAPVWWLWRVNVLSQVSVVNQSRLGRHSGLSTLFLKKQQNIKRVFFSFLVISLASFRHYLGGTVINM